MEGMETYQLNTVLVKLYNDIRVDIVEDAQGVYKSAKKLIDGLLREQQDVRVVLVDWLETNRRIIKTILQK